jgi:hypothetical protein
MSTHPLILLLGLRLRGWLRRAGRSLSSVKGIVLTILGLLVFAPTIMAMFFDRGARTLNTVEMWQRFMPWGLLAYSILTLVFTRAEQAVVFSPAEMQFLFPAPFTRRQLLGYKIASSLGLLCFSALIMSIFMVRNLLWAPAAYIGILLALWFMQLFSMLVMLATQAAGAASYTWPRRLFALAILLGLGFLAYRAGMDSFANWNPENFQEFEARPLIRAILAPFQWMTRTLTATSLPELLLWGGLSLLLNLALIAAILLLDAQYLESSSAASEKLYARIERMRKSGIAPSVRHRGNRKPRLSLPLPPRWGGVGPIAWRQGTTALRDFGRALLLIVIYSFALLPVAIASLNQRGNAGGRAPFEFLYIMEIMILAMGLFLPALFPFDFRGDTERIDLLKSLPLSSIRLVLGEILVPILMLTCLQWTLLALIAAIRGNASSTYFLIAFGALPINTALVIVENLIFLLFPYRLQAQTPGDMQTIGRSILNMLAKMLVLGIMAAIAGALGALAFFLSRNLDLALILAWTVAGLLALALLPVLAWAFRAFDVSRDTPS